jgi:hypothetical protein
MQASRTALFGCLFLLTFFTRAHSAGFQEAEKQEINRSYDNIESVDIATRSGDCIIQTGSGDIVQVSLSHTYARRHFEPQFRVRGRELILKEEFRGMARGRSVWRLTVPKNTRIAFATASGDLEISELSDEISARSASGDVSVENSSGGINVSTASGDLAFQDISGEIKINTASGDIEIRSFSGDASINTASGRIRGRDVDGTLSAHSASGDVSISDSRGVFAINSASGDLDMTDIAIEGESTFSSASGDVIIELADSAVYDLTLTSASGRAILNYGGAPLTASFEFTARAGRGRIVAPFRFDREEQFFQGGQLYERKTLVQGRNNPKITIATASGRAELRR